jgi:hypothetical protein
MSDTYTSSSYFYSSTTNTTDGTTTTGSRYITSSHTEPDGTTIVRTAHQDLGQPAVVEERRYDRTGQEQLALPGPAGTSAGGVKRITELEDEDATGATSLDAGTAYGGPAAGGTARQDIDENVIDRESMDLGTTPFGMRGLDPLAGAYEEHSDHGTDGRRFERVGETGLSSTAKESREYEDPSTGARLRRQSDVDVSEVI